MACYKVVVVSGIESRSCGYEFEIVILAIPWISNYLKIQKTGLSGPGGPFQSYVLKPLITNKSSSYYICISDSIHTTLWKSKSDDCKSVFIDKCFSFIFYLFSLHISLRVTRAVTLFPFVSYCVYAVERDEKVVYSTLCDSETLLVLTSR